MAEYDDDEVEGEHLFLEGERLYVHLHRKMMDVGEDDCLPSCQTDKMAWKEIFFYWRAAAELGHKASCLNIGLMFENGHGTQRNEQKALEWYERAAVDDSIVGAQANFHLGALYEASAHFSEAAHCWTNASANLEHAGALNNLAILYRSGCGVKQSDSEAEVLWHRAAELGHSSAQANLGSQLERRRGLTKDATIWYERSALQGSRKGQHNYGRALELGQGIKKNNVLALHYYDAAAAQGCESSECASQRLRSHIHNSHES